MPSLLEYVFSYILATVLLFQGLHLFMETKAPLGTVPEEVQQGSSASRKWGAVLLVWSVLALGTGMLGHVDEGFASAVLPMRNLGIVLLLVFGAWVVFVARSVQFMGTPSADDHGHASDQSHH